MHYYQYNLIYINGSLELSSWGYLPMCDFELIKVGAISTDEKKESFLRGAWQDINEMEYKTPKETLKEAFLKEFGEYII